jgi:uncharacterized RDD family membrane protein YckC
VSGSQATAPRHPPQAPGDQKSASIARRLGALLYEALLLTAMAFVAGFLFLPLVSGTGASPHTLTVPPPPVRSMMFGALVAGAAIYYGWCWSDGRRTLPQKTWRLRLVGRHGRPVTRRQALARYFAAWIGPTMALVAFAAWQESTHARSALAFLALNYVWAIVDPERQFLHDRIAQTRIVRDA